MEELVCYGLGNVALDSKPLYQLACAELLREALNQRVPMPSAKRSRGASEVKKGGSDGDMATIKCTAFDPVFDQVGFRADCRRPSHQKPDLAGVSIKMVEFAGAPLRYAPLPCPLSLTLTLNLSP